MELAFEFAPGSTIAQPAGTPLPIAVSGKDSKPLLAQLELRDPSVRPNWIGGRHRVEILGWVNHEKRAMPANARCVFNIHIPDTLAANLTVGEVEQHYEDIEIEEWKP